MEFFPFTVAVGATQRVPIPASRVYFQTITAGAAFPTIQVKALGNKIGGAGTFTLKPGQGVGYPAEADAFEIQNYDGQNTIMGLLLMLGPNESIQDNRITGEVSVNDGGMAKTLAGQAFIGTGNSPATASNYSHVQLFNPAGSGKRTAVRALWIKGDADNLQVSEYDVALTSLSAQVSSKYIGGAQGVTQIRHQENTSQLITGANLIAPLLGTATLPLLFQEPFVIDPGKGLNLLHAVVNLSLNVGFEVTEVPL